MVNIGAKAVTRRVAVAEAIVSAPPAVMKHFRGGDIRSRKGPVFQTAILAGVMAAKNTSHLIPLCHPIGLDDCNIEIVVRHKNRMVITCRCEVHHKTGVEMEALTGATVAALTIYDMCKALSRKIVIQHVRLVQKTGGKHDFKAG